MVLSKLKFHLGVLVRLVQMNGLQNLWQDYEKQILEVLNMDPQGSEYWYDGL